MRRVRPFNLNNRWYAIVEMLQILRMAGIRVEGKDWAEIGTGWQPLLGPLYYGLGVRSIRLTDINANVHGDFVERALEFLILRAGEIAPLAGVPAETLEARWRELLPKGADWRKVFAARGLTYDAPLDFTKTGWASGSVDGIYSNSCLCYIPTPILRGIFQESARVVKKGGFIAHNVDPVDILTGTMQYLNYTEEEWDRVGNSRLHWQNRLRPAAFTKMAKESGFEIVYEERLPFPKPQKIDRAALHPEFRDLPESELLTFHFLFAGRRT